MPDLQRFHAAQAGQFGAGHAVALSELRGGAKTSHWIWYEFPQLAGLGHSSMAKRFGLRGAAEAMEYLLNSQLRGNLLDLARAVVGHLHRHPPVKLEILMGSRIDAVKLVSSMTLFREVCRSLVKTKEDPEGQVTELLSLSTAILDAASMQGYGECRTTLNALRP